jgi:hypothetical protein
MMWVPLHGSCAAQIRSGHSRHVVVDTERRESTHTSHTAHVCSLRCPVDRSSTPSDPDERHAPRPFPSSCCGRAAHVHSAHVEGDPARQPCLKHAKPGTR